MKKRKDGRWCKSVTIDGKRLFFYSSEATEKKAIRDIERQMMEYHDKDEQGKTFGEVVDEWEDKHFKGIAVQTEQAYKACSDYACEYFKDVYIKDIGPAEIERFLNYRAQKGFCMKTIKNQKSVLNLIFKFAYVNKYVNTNPCQFAALPSHLPKSKRKIPTENEIECVENSINCTFGLLAYFLLYTGLRKGEALALQWKDIDFKNKVIHVTKSVYHSGNVGKMKEPKTEAGYRDVVLLDCLCEKLKKGDPTGLVFPGNNGEIMRKSTFKHRWARYQQETGLIITPHQLRHAFASYILFDAGIDVKTAQSLLGHSDITTTQNIYTQITNNHQVATADKINDFVNGGRRVVKFRTNRMNA